MITDIFARRYANIELRTQYLYEDQVLCYQLWIMLSSGLLWDSIETDKVSDMAEAEFKAIHDLLALELGFDIARFCATVPTIDNGPPSPLIANIDDGLDLAQAG